MPLLSVLLVNVFFKQVPLVLVQLIEVLSVLLVNVFLSRCQHWCWCSLFEVLLVMSLKAFLAGAAVVGAAVGQIL